MWSRRHDKKRAVDGEDGLDPDALDEVGGTYAGPSTNSGEARRGVRAFNGNFQLVETASASKHG